VQANEDTNPVAILSSRKVESVTFIHDYIQLGFGSAGISVYVWPIIDISGSQLLPNSVGYKDALCERIGKEVIRAEVTKQCLSISFEDNVVLLISLLLEDRQGPEAFELSSLSGGVWVVG